MWQVYSCGQVVFERTDVRLCHHFTACLEYIVDKKPKGNDLLIVQEQRILYTKFREELIEMKNALK